MGRPSSSQPEHSAIGIEPYPRPHARRRARSRARQLDSRATSSKLPTSLSANKHTSRQRPSPLITSLSPEQFFDAKEDFSLPSSPVLSEDEDEEMFYDAEEGSIEQHKALPSVQLIIPKPQYDGASKGRVGRPPPPRYPAASAPISSPHPTSPPAPSPAMNGFNFSFARGPSKPTSTPVAETHVTTLAAKQAQQAVPLAPREAVKKALIVGINYEDLPEDKRLYYAVRDAELWHKTLLGKGVSAENITLLTDGKTGGESPTYEALIKQIRWLVQGAVAGDCLFFVFSGHAVPTHLGPSIVTADKRTLHRPILENELVLSIPAGVDLQVVFDCCHSAGMIGLQYCVGRMDRPTPQSDSHGETSEACPPASELSESLESTLPMDMAPPRSSSPYPHAPQQGSLFGLPMTTEAAPRHPPVAPAMVGQGGFTPLPQPQRRRHGAGGVQAAPPLTNAAAAPVGNQPGPAAGVVSYLGSLVGIGSTTAPVSTPPPASALVPPESSSAPVVRPATASGTRHTRQGVAEGTRMPDYFEERTGRFVRPAGKMVWAGTGETQKAFETYGRSRQGVVTKAMCAALERVTTRRDLWSYLVQEIESENDKRSKRDACKAVNEQPIRATRIQHAQLWVSQGHGDEPLRSAAPVLDQSVL